MRAICIIGSPNENGSTASICIKVIRGLDCENIEVDKYILDKMDIGFCKGCNSCEISGRCVQRDDMDILIKAITEADIVILASPSYWGDVTGQMKVFIDRSLPLCNAKTGETPVPDGKMGIGIAIRAGNSKNENQHIIDTFSHYFGHLGITMAGEFMAEGINNLSDLKEKQDKLSQAYDLGKMISFHNKDI
ncbi:MAG: flavodoxin family protein [candidate division Zixibacteria bacterium]|nr:flavodoxin family protein [candidate division Zixibacteria bacterium]